MMGYSTVYQIKKDFEWDTNHGTNPFSNIRENKRLSKLSKKVINNYISSQKDSFTIGDIRKAIISESNEEIKNHIISKYLKETLNMSYRRCTNKSTNVDVPKLSILRMLFSFRIGKHINESTLMISIDETTFNHKVVNNKSWIIKGYSAELFNSKFVGSCSLIMAITSRGSYFGLITKGRIDSNIYLKYLIKLEEWIESTRSSISQKVTILKDNWQVHRAKKVLSFIHKSQFNYVYIPMYTPEFSPVEKIFALLKSKWKSFQTRKSVDWGKPDGFKIIASEMETIESSQIVAIWRNFIRVIKSSMKLLFIAINR